MSLLSVTTLPEKNTFNSPLNNNVLQNITLDTQLPEAIKYTQPYWQKKKGMYTVQDQKILEFQM
jgi:hypothetical protein